MVSAAFPAARIHAIACTSAAVWAGACACAHAATPRLWPGYSRLSARERLAWCNRIASGLHVRGPVV